MGITITTITSWISLMILILLIRHTESSIQKDRDSIQVAKRFFVEANALYESGDLYGALSNYEQAVYYNPFEADFYCNMASLLSDLREVEKSSLAYQKALELDRYHASSLFNYALLLQDKKFIYEAISIYRRLLEIEATNADVSSDFFISYTCIFSVLMNFILY